jgi:hypothetical protein
MFKICMTFIACITSLSLNSVAKQYYVSANGKDANKGDISAPFLSIQRAQKEVEPGDTVYIRGGNYRMTEEMIAEKSNNKAFVIFLNKNGQAGKRINYWAYPGENPVFDFQDVKPLNLRVHAFQVVGSYIHLKGLEVIGVQVTILGHTQSECFENQGSHNIYEQLSMHDGQAIGFYLTNGSDNLILNCDAYQNYDYTSENGKGGNTDGFGCHPGLASSVNNIFRGCRAWFNSDDGYDCINAHAATIFENCWAFYNGYSPSFKPLADGNGFKAGGYGGTAPAKLPVDVPRNTVRFCLAVKNKNSGFYSNHHQGGSDWYNNSAYLNGINYNMVNRKSKTEDGYLVDVPGYGHVLKNNVGYAARNAEVKQIDESKSEQICNSFNFPVVITAKDFQSLDLAELTKARKADGRLPDIQLMCLKSDSQLIDQGTVIGFPFQGKAPDLGYREY